MARITHVQKAQQRYKMVPVLDENGEPKRTPVMRRNGEQKVTKRGKPVFRTVTRQDKTQPLPELRCDFPGCDINESRIAVGTAYKHITPKSGPYGGQQKNRHAEHPSWQVWEYSSSLSARVAQIVHDAEQAVAAAEDEGGVTEALENAADEIESLAEEKREGASNIEEGFGHPTSASEELDEIATSLDEWAQSVRYTEVPSLADYPCEECNGEGERECEACEGEGKVARDSEDEDPHQCEECAGTGQVDCEVCDENHCDPDAWRDAVESDVLSILGEVPF